MHTSRQRLRKLWSGLCCVSVVSLMIPTAPATGAPRVLGLDQLIQMALERSPELKRAAQDIAAALSDLEQAKGARWAQIDITAVGGMVDNARRPIVVVDSRPGTDGSLRGRIKEGDAQGYGPFGKLEFTLTQPLYTFGKIAHRQDAAADTVAAQRAAQEKTRGEVILKVKELYFSLLLAQQGKDVVADIASFVTDARQRIKRLLNAGSPNVDEGDLYRLEAYEAEARRFRARAESGANITSFTLKQMTGLSREQELTLDVKELPRDTRALRDQYDYIQQALRGRPELEQLTRGLEARQNLVEAAKADLYPSIFAAGVASLAGTPGRQHLDEPYIGDNFNRAQAGAVLGANWHFDFGILQGKVHKAQAEYQRLLHTKELATLHIPIEVNRHYQEAIENLTAFQALEQATAASRKGIVLAFSNFDIGLGQARDIFSALDRYGRNRGDYLEALLKYHLALARLSYAIGEYRSTE